MNRSQYAEKIQAQLQEWSADMSKLLAKARAKKAEGLAKLQDEVDELHQKRQAIAKRLDAVRDQADGAWERIKPDLERAVETLKQEGRRLWNAADSKQPTGSTS